ncbi:MAG: RNA polymerase sigma factor [Bacteroides sp.]
MDWELVQRACDGDEEAFRVLHDKYRSKIYYLVLKIVNNPTDAEDVTIEAFTKAFKNITQYVPRYAFSSWLFKIATNNSIDYCRRKRMVQKDYEDPSGDGINKEILMTTSGLDPEQQMIRDQNMERLKSLVTQLRPQYQKLVQLRYFEELSYEEISVELALPMGTVKAQLFRARNMLQELLRQSPEGDFKDD